MSLRNPWLLRQLELRDSRLENFSHSSSAVLRTLENSIDGTYYTLDIRNHAHNTHVYKIIRAD